MKAAQPTTDILAAIAEAYVALLSVFPWGVPVARLGAREGLNKFVSNAYLGLIPGTDKYRKTQWITQAASERLALTGGRHLVFEHVVPKDAFQKRCEALASRGSLTLDDVLPWLRRHWIIATITKEEEGALKERRLARKMPLGWKEGDDPFARYRIAGLKVVRSDLDAPGLPEIQF